MKERPILFSDAMVRAILDGRKTQTRRVVTKWCGPKLPPGNGASQDGYCTVEDHTIARKPWTADLISRLIACPYGERSDRLWVKERCWISPERTQRMMREGADTWPRVIYYADQPEDKDWCKEFGWHHRTRIHMPRWASRILLEITNVRVERVQEISDTDAFAEGIQQVVNEGLRDDGSVRGSFRALWDSINASRGYGWDVNPWVWVIEFRRITP